MLSLFEVVLLIVLLVGFGLWWSDQPSSVDAKKAVYSVINFAKRMLVKIKKFFDKQ